MSGITVSLTSTKYASKVVDGNIDQLIKFDVPVCSSIMGLGMFGFKAEKEKYEHIWSEMCLKMAKYVYVDSINHSVYIGDDKEHSENTGLIEYTTEKVNEYEISFFKRWEIIKSLIFEHTIVDLENKPIFCLKGLWVIDKWDKLDICTENTISVKKR